MYWNDSTDFNSAETTWNYNRKIVVMWCGLNSETLSLQGTKRKVSPLSILVRQAKSVRAETKREACVRLEALEGAAYCNRKSNNHDQAPVPKAEGRSLLINSDQSQGQLRPVPFLHPYGLERRSWYVGVSFVLDVIGQDPRWWGNVENPGKICQAVQLYQQCLKVGHSDVHVAVFAYIIDSTN